MGSTKRRGHQIKEEWHERDSLIVESAFERNIWNDISYIVSRASSSMHLSRTWWTSGVLVFLQSSFPYETRTDIARGSINNKYYDTIKILRCKLSSFFCSYSKKWLIIILNVTFELPRYRINRRANALLFLCIFILVPFTPFPEWKTRIAWCVSVARNSFIAAYQYPKYSELHILPTMKG